MKNPKSFEEGMERLQGLLERLASPDTPLDEALSIYSETAALAEYCTSALQKAKLEMQTIDARLTGLTEQSGEAGEL